MSALTVTQLSALLKQHIESEFGAVQVEGEISECKIHSSGHIYLTLKDEKSVLSAVIWMGARGRVGLKPQVGQAVLATGRLSIYAGQSRYQLVIERLELAGQGALLLQLEERKKRLAAEGLFDAGRKKPLPFLPQKIGVITSPTGAVIRDILHRLADRCPVHVLLWPVAVQGAGAGAQIAQAIEGFNSFDPQGKNPTPNFYPDVLIVARGGGSLEDLLPFSDEIVVRAAAASHIPLISAVGHETDTTLIDYAADVRAPTPTAAAEMAVPVAADLLAGLSDARSRLMRGITQQTTRRKDQLAYLHRLLGDPRRMLEPLMQRLDDKTDMLKLGLKRLMERQGDKLSRHGQLLQSLGPPRVLERGYALVWNKHDLATRAANLPDEGTLTIQFADGKRSLDFSSRKD